MLYAAKTEVIRVRRPRTKSILFVHNVCMIESDFVVEVRNIRSLTKTLGLALCADIRGYTLNSADDSARFAKLVVLQLHTGK